MVRHAPWNLATNLAGNPGFLIVITSYSIHYTKLYDEIYDALFVNPCKRLGTFLWKGVDAKVVDGIVNGTGAVVQFASRALRLTQTGVVHNYALSMVIGVLLVVGFYILK